MEALSVNRLLAVAVEYVVGLLVGARCDGMADAGDAVGNGWLNCMDWELLFCGAVTYGVFPFGATD